jgi:hypothetical protein
MKADPAARRAGMLFRCRRMSRSDVQPRSGGRNQNRMHVQKALMEYLLLGRIG